MITSLSNGRIKQLITLRDKSRARNKEGLFLAEGFKMFEEAPLGQLKEVYVSEVLWRELEKDAEKSRIWKKLNACREQGIFMEQLSEEVFRKVSDTQTPQGILFVMDQLSYELETLIKQAVIRQKEGGRAPLFLMLEDIQDPGNLGTMIRTGEGAGVDGVIMSRGTVDIYNPKTIRSTMGSLYRVPFLYVEELAPAITLLQQSGIRVYAAHLNGKQYFDELSYEGGSAFLIGNEGNGLRRETADMADTYLKIPMEGKLESLNAAVAAALLLYQAAGCHRKTKGF
ncbi:MAG: RNA methyltransferase [Lachnospiraceae bacterium]|nr:RNA methyltransferase [Lachnospiraceae bacterium]